MAERFKRGSGCFTCSDCGRRTRATDHGDNAHCELCPDCYEVAGILNSISDNPSFTAEQVQAQMDRINEIRHSQGLRSECD
jgi:hypothetical protein